MSRLSRKPQSTADAQDRQALLAQPAVLGGSPIDEGRRSEPTSSMLTAIGFVRGSDRDVRTGLVGYVTCIIANTLQLDGITLRLTADRRPTLSFPTRTDSKGRKHAYIKPIDNETRLALEAEVFNALGIDPEVGL